MNKKRIIAVVAGIAAAITLAGCSGTASSPATTASSGSGSSASKPSGPPTEMNMMNFAGDLGTTIAGIAAGFEKKYNVHINWGGGVGSGSANVATITASAGHQIYDDSLVDGQSQFQASAAGLWAKLDPKVVDTSNVYPLLKAKNNDSVPIGIITTDLYYNSTVFKQNGWKAPKSFDDLLNPKYCGKVGILDVGQSYGLYTVLGLGGLTPKDAAAGNLNGAWEKGLAKLQKNVSCFPSIEASSGGLEQKMQTGQYVVGTHGSVRILPLIKAGVPLKAVIPSEGALLTASFVSPVKNAPHPKLSQEFAAWFLRPAAQKALMNQTFYGPSVSTVKVPADLVAFGVPNESKLTTLVLPSPAEVTKERPTWTAEYQRALG